MSAHNEVRVASAGRCVAELSKLPGLRCLLLTGSVASGHADAVSDVDMAVYFDEVPPRELLEEFRAALQGSDWVFFFGDPAEGGCAISFYMDGIKHDFGISRLQSWYEWMDELMLRWNHASELQKVARGVLGSRVLLGEDCAAELRSKLCPYPRELGLAMVRAHLSFFPAWVPLRMAFERGDLLHYQQILVEECNHLLHILCGINGIYHYGEFKRLGEYEAAFTIRPPHLAARVNGLFELPAPQAVQEHHKLIGELLDLLTEHMPEVDLTRQQARLALRAGQP